MADIWGRAFWPGADSCSAATYTISHGITPGVAVYTMSPQVLLPAMTGDLIFDDGNARIVIPRCKLDKINVRRDGNGLVWDVILLDRRWRWRELGTISGVYNQVDSFGKTLPWTARTPKQLCELCLAAMGETRYELRLPAVSLNPPVQWDHVPPAQALQSFADSLGCRVIYRLDTDSVLVAPPGEGLQLPLGSISSDGPTMDPPERPDQLIVYGQPIRYQARFLLEAVGEDWDGSIRPIRELSYAPDVPDNPVRHTFTLTPATVTTGNIFTVTIHFAVVREELAGNNFEVSASKTYTFTATAATVANVTAGLTAAINAGNAGGLPWTATDNTTTITLTGNAAGDAFDVVCAAAQGAGSAGCTLKQNLTTLGRAGKLLPWDYAPPPHFGAVKATDRLTKRQAIELAKKSIYRYYRIRAVDPSDVTRPLRIGDYLGRIERREQIVLHQTRAEQIEPQPQDEAVFDDQGRPRLVLFYDGHSRDKPARVIGAYSHGYTGTGVNTRTNSDVAVPFSIDTERQLVIFSQYVAYSVARNQWRASDLILETGCNIRDHVTNALVTVEGSLTFPPPFFGTPPLYIQRDDVQYTVIGDYDSRHNLTGSHELLPNVPPGRREVAPIPPTARQKIQYYLAAYARQFENVLAQERVYNGLVPIWLDGAIQQVTWSVGEQGVETHASRNSEHHKYIPPYPVRRRNDILDPVTRGKMGANLPLVRTVDSLHSAPGTQSTRGGSGL